MVMMKMKKTLPALMLAFSTACAGCASSPDRLRPEPIAVNTQSIPNTGIDPVPAGSIRPNALAADQEAACVEESWKLSFSGIMPVLSKKFCGGGLSQ